MTPEGRPASHAEFMALPEGGGFGISTREYTPEEFAQGWVMINDTKHKIADGAKRISIPVAPDVICFFSEPNDLVTVWDQSGEEDRCWTLGRYADGTWFRREVL